MPTVAHALEPHAAQFTAPTRVAIVADDLTGACDSSVAFLASGRTVRVLLDALRSGGRSLALDPNSNSAEDHNTVLALTTESRDLTASEAAARVADCIAQFAPHVPGALVFKKIDSAARGHFAAEIDAALHACGAALALVAPAFPAAGRTVANGILTIRDWNGEEHR